MRTLILSTDERAVNNIHQFISIRNIATETRTVHLNLNEAFSFDAFEVLQASCDLFKYDLIVLSDKEHDQDIAGAIASNLNLPCVTSCSNISCFDGGLKFQREVYGGLAHMNLSASMRPLVMTISCAAFDEETIAGLSIERQEVHPTNPRVRITSMREIEKTVDIGSAKRIVAVGRGIGKKEDLVMINRFTAVLDAELGCSRPLSEDYKWLPLERQIGLTGETVKPLLYIAVGVSGQVQHIAGMRDSKIVVAINNNKGAPIFDSCDYGLVGDLYEIVPLLTEMLSDRAK